MHTIDKALIQRAKRRDRFARWIITLAGVVIIVAVIAIVLLIISVTFPLFRGASAEIKAATPLPASVAGKSIMSLGVDLVELGDRAGGDSLTAYILSNDGTCTFLEFSEATESLSPPAGSPVGLRVLGQHRAAPPDATAEPTIRFLERFGGSNYSLLWSDGSVSLVEAELIPQFDELGQRSVKHNLAVQASLPPQPGPLPLQALLRSFEGAMTCVRLLPDNRLSVSRQTTRESLLGESETTTSQLTIEEGIPGPISVMTMDAAGKMLYAGTTNGCLAYWQLGDDGGIAFHEVIRAFRDARAVTSLALVHGEVSLAVGDARGELTTWFEVRNELSRKLRPIHRLSKHGQAVRDILASSRDKSLVSLGRDGKARLDYMTNERHLLTLAADEPLELIGYAPRGNALIALDRRQQLIVWRIDCPHPDADWRSLFGQVHYEGYAQPAYKWQTTGDEPKFSLVPIIFGTLKSTCYAMLFAMPLALCGAIYVSHFTTPGWKRAIKPTVEIMAAVPSVVIGFLILLWLAPLLGKWLVAAFASMLTIPVVFLVFLLLWQGLRKYDWAKRVEHGYEFLVLVPVILLGGVLAVLAADPLEALLFDGSFPQWLFDFTHKPYDPLNSLVVALGLGFAVIPIIFSISEDALSDIPYNLTAASLALGASRWQTLWRVILPSASPGIFAATMIGFGRAVGETMIVFMATGNTPLLDLSPFNGFRTLSANIAVEIPEAPVHGTLYRVLFLCAVLLFLLTFLLNTTAEVVRQHLRTGTESTSPGAAAEAILAARRTVCLADGRRPDADAHFGVAHCWV